jgi:hypothetical protein
VMDVAGSVELFVLPQVRFFAATGGLPLGSTGGSRARRVRIHVHFLSVPLLLILRFYIIILGAVKIQSQAAD